jgi:hypothetical protein
VSGWPFSDPPNVAVFVTSDVMQGSPIVYVRRSDDDGSWEFHDANPRGNPKLVSLREVVERDPTIAELFDLPLGWCARRDGPARPWIRSP